MLPVDIIRPISDYSKPVMAYGNATLDSATLADGTCGYTERVTAARFAYISVAGVVAVFGEMLSIVFSLIIEIFEI